MPSRFALVAPNFHPRVCGVSDYTARFALELRRRGHEVVILSREPATEHPEAPGIPIVPVPGTTAARIAGGVLDRLVEVAPDRVLLQYVPWMFGASRFGSPAIPRLVRALHDRSIAVTLVAHEIFIPWSARPDLALAGALQRLQLAILLQRADRVVITTSSRQRELERIRAPGGRAPIAMIPVGAGALPASRVLQPGRCRLGTFSTLAQGKQIEIMLDAFTRIGAALPDSELVVIGDLSQAPARFRRLLAQVERHPYANRVRFTGRLSLPQISEEIARLDVYFHAMGAGATTRSSTLPLALGFGIPVVAFNGEETDLGVFQDGENIVFADVFTADGFAAAALRVLREPELARRVGAGGRQLYSRCLSWERIVDRFLEEEPRAVASASIA